MYFAVGVAAANDIWFPSAEYLDAVHSRLQLSVSNLAASSEAADVEFSIRSQAGDDVQIISRAHNTVSDIIGAYANATATDATTLRVSLENSSRQFATVYRAFGGGHTPPLGAYHGLPRLPTA